MEGRMVDLIEDIGKGITSEQLAPKPAKGDNKDDRDNGASAGKNA